MVQLETTTQVARTILEAAGVLIILVGALYATGASALKIIKGSQMGLEMFRGYRRRLGRAILLGLEFLVAGDIINSVAIAPSFRSVGVLSTIVLIRTFLSFTLEVEMTGRWPWQRKEKDVTNSV
ncbi:MAG: DUF1622 domain-containing protein [Chitinivibrionales bacterium]|nr:DUF1622 domain-containing protein [Chitinivibrionales bacterium]MBD3358824.1 DUF1622 domain-containing protein [Chitinivibrionales bacterium]